jgi:hypothetical protein
MCAKQEVSLPRATASSGPGFDSPATLLPPCIVNGVAVSKTFQIMYRNEEVLLGDLVNFRLHVVLDSAKIQVRIGALTRSETVPYLGPSVSDPDSLRPDSDPAF